MFENVVRADLDKMVSWWIGMENDFQVSTGKMGKYFVRYLPDAHWRLYRDTYSNGDDDAFWEAIFSGCELFRTLAKDVSHHLSYSYPIDDDRSMTKYLMHVRTLPRSAEAIY